MQAHEILLRAVEGTEVLEMPWRWRSENVSLLRFKKSECKETATVEEKRSLSWSKLPAAQLSFAVHGAETLTLFLMKLRKCFCEVESSKSR